MSSEFAKWFEAQHGPRERGLLGPSYSDQMLRDDIRRGEMADAELKRRELWDAKRTAALYAWTAAWEAPR